MNKENIERRSSKYFSQ